MGVLRNYLNNNVEGTAKSRCKKENLFFFQRNRLPLIFITHLTIIFKSTKKAYVIYEVIFFILRCVIINEKKNHLHLR